MSNKSTIKCPNCGNTFPIGDALATEIEAGIKQRYVDRFNQDQKELEEKKKKLEAEAEKLKTLQEDQDKIIAEKIKQKGQILEQEAEKKASEAVDLKVKSMEREIEEKAKQLKESQAKEIDILEREKKLREEKESFKLEVEKEVFKRQEQIEEKAKQFEAEKSALKIKELEKKLSDQTELAETMKRKIEQSSQQSQGETAELMLEQILKTTFPFDTIEEVGKGVKGADWIQIVKNNQGQECGKIVYESKSTVNFSPDWIEKLKSDVRLVQGSIGVIVTKAMPKGMDGFGPKDGVWICSFSEIKSIAYLLRDGIIKVAGATKAQENKGEKMTMLYNYLTSNEFSDQWNAVREGFLGMKLSIQKERDAMERLWKAREKQLEKVLLNASHIRGSIDGIAGLESIDLNLLDEGENLELDR